MIYGIYVVLYGHVTPGGGFAGGVIIACGFILLRLADGPEAVQSGRTPASFLDSAGILLFLALATMGMWAEGAFFQGFANHAKVTLHVDNLRGRNAHHIAETVFKAFGRALRMAVEVDQRMAHQLPSTKGSL